MEQQNQMIKLSGLWLNEKNGKRYFSGTLGDAKVLIFKNDYKTEDKHPDYNMFLAPKPAPKAEARQQEQSKDEYPF